MKDVTQRQHQHQHQHRRRWWSPQAWLPWTPFAASAADYRRRAAAAGPLTPAYGRQAALLTFTAALVVATAVFSLALPQISLLIEVLGGFLVSVIVLVALGRIGDVPIALGELRVTLKESTEQSGLAPRLHLVRLSILHMLLDIQARRTATREMHDQREDEHNGRDVRGVDANGNSHGRRDVGVHLHERRHWNDEHRNQNHEPSGRRWLGARERRGLITGRPLQRCSSNHVSTAAVQAAAPALALAAPTPSDRRTDTAPSLAPRFLPTAGGGVDQRPPRFARGGESVPVPVPPPPLSPPSRPARGAPPVSPSSAPLPVPHPTLGDGGTEQ